MNKHDLHFDKISNINGIKFGDMKKIMIIENTIHINDTVCNIYASSQLCSVIGTDINLSTFFIHIYTFYQGEYFGMHEIVTRELYESIPEDEFFKSAINEFINQVKYQIDEEDLCLKEIIKDTNTYGDKDKYKQAINTIREIFFKK